MSTVLITGCAGFIGSHATDHFLQNGYKVIGVDSFTYAANINNLENAMSYNSFTLERVDICNTEKILNICLESEVEWIINFAAETHVDNSILSDAEFIRSNIIGVKSLLDVCRKLGTKLFHISTDEVYGPAEDYSFTEEDKLSPKNPYSATKAAAEHIIESYHNTYGVEYITVRPSNNFGPRQHSEKFLPTITRSLRSGEKIPIYGDGTNIRDWLYVGDNVETIYSILKNGSLNQVYNITFKNEMTNLQLVKKVVSALDRDFHESVKFVTDRLGHDFKYSISNDKISQFVAAPSLKFDQNLQYTIEWLYRYGDIE